VVYENEENSPGPSLNWVDIIREAEESDLILQDDGTYHYIYRGRLVRLSEHERGYVIRLRNLLKPWPHPEDMRKENEAIEAVMEELGQYENTLMAGTLCLQILSWMDIDIYYQQLNARETSRPDSTTAVT
jgi:hypothetical protein